jgi:hypothetical protein
MDVDEYLSLLVDVILLNLLYGSIDFISIIGICHSLGMDS